MKNSGFQMHGIFPATREQERLQKVVEEIHFRRKNGGRPEIRDVNIFTSQLLALANTYRTLRQEHETAEIARKRFSEIGKLAEKLSSAMDGLSDFERKLLCDMQGRAFHDCSGLDENALADREDLLRSGYSQAQGGKPWCYLLVPHDVVANNVTISALISRFRLG